MSWKIDAGTGDYIMEDGAPVDSDSIAYNAFYRLRIKRNTWLYAPNDQYGSDLHLIKKRPVAGRTASVESIAERALQPIVQDGRAKSTDVTINTEVTTVRNNVIINAHIVDAQQKPQELNLPMIIGG